MMKQEDDREFLNMHQIYLNRNVRWSQNVADRIKKNIE